MSKGLYGRKDRIIKEKLHNVYRERDKSLPPSRCPKCGVLFIDGRWLWGDEPDISNEVVCPACRRIKDRFPAGYVELKGKFFAEHRQEILNLVMNIETREKEERPLERIIAVEDGSDQAEVTTTGIHIARRIGEAVANAYSGNLTLQYADGEKQIRVYWQR